MSQYHRVRTYLGNSAPAPRLPSQKNGYMWSLPVPHRTRNLASSGAGSLSDFNAWNGAFVTKQFVSAQHEVGHYILARKSNLKVAFVSIMQGDGHAPKLRGETVDALSREEKLEYFLAGWAGTAYAATHRTEDVTFHTARFLISAAWNTEGGGWHFNGSQSEDSDFSRAEQLGVRWWNIGQIAHPLVGAGRYIHQNRDLFDRVCQNLLKYYMLFGCALEKLAAGSELNSDDVKENEFAKTEYGFYELR